MVRADGEACAEADFTFGLFDTVARKLVPPTPAWFQAVGLENETKPASDLSF
jgi:hypothetical protein